MTRIGRLFAALLVFLFSGSVFPCTNILVTKGASADGSTMITYAADSHTLYGECVLIPAAEYAPGIWVDVHEWDTGKYLGRIRQAEKTYAVVGNMNEHQVSIGETTWGGREELTDDSTGVLDYGTLMFTALQRSRTAREAIQVMTSLVREYGYYSSGESFSIADPNEVWIMDMIGKGRGSRGAVWAARLVPDGMICAHANHPRIRQIPMNDKANCLHSPDVVSFAREKGYFKGTDAEFSFADAYGPADFGALRFCEARVWSVFRNAAPSLNLSADAVRPAPDAKPLPLWIKPDRKLTVRDVMGLMRDHFENSEFDMTNDIGAGPYKCPYRWRPMTWKSDGQDYLFERAISTQQTGFSFVSQMRSWLPDPVGGVFWFGVDDTYSTVYVPLYCGIDRVPAPFAPGSGSFDRFSWDSAFWVFNWVSNTAYSRYCDMIVDIQQVQRELEGGYFADQRGVDAAAMILYKQSPRLARDYLTAYSAAAGGNAFVRWKKLGEFLLWKYLDGNVKNEFGRPRHPGYPADWYKAVAEDTGDRMKVTPFPPAPVSAP
ncbi:C69 family dipeptidase [bacterium]|nr:C69 family dipeptidase [bacterium]